MCGIAGAITATGVDPDRIAACLRALRHRGPNARGHTRHVHPDGRTIDLLHTRLSVVDLDPRSDQPMTVGATTVVFNGECYDARELRARRGWDADRRTDGDTEVFARLLDAGGVAGLDAVEAMFAVAWFDARTGRLMVARDRFGEKPLYVRTTPEGTFFASEPRALAALSGEPLVPNLRHVRRFLVQGYKALWKPHGDGFLEDIREVPAGCAMDVSVPPDDQQPERWWHPALAEDDTLTFDDAVALVRERLIEAVALRLRADVPVACMLSGGVDSNAITAIAARVVGAPVRAFTIVDEDERYDERPLVRQAVDALGLPHTEVRLRTDGFLDRLGTMVAHRAAPVLTISYYAHWLLMEAVAASGCVVSLSGTAADELFTGYYDHHNLYLAEVFGTPDHGRALADWREHVAGIVRNPWLQDPDVFVRDPLMRAHISLDADVFASWLVDPSGDGLAEDVADGADFAGVPDVAGLAGTADGASTANVTDRASTGSTSLTRTRHARAHGRFPEAFTEEPFHGRLLRNRMLNELWHEVVPPILHEDDRNAMHHSIENRSPFLDRGLFDVARRIPTRHLVRDGRRKAVLREAMRGIVPDAIVEERRKVGFNAPIASMLDPQDPETRAALLDPGPIHELVRRDAIERLLDEPRFANSRSKFLFSYVSARMFLEAFPP